MLSPHELVWTLTQNMHVPGKDILLATKQEKVKGEDWKREVGDLVGYALLISENSGSTRGRITTGKMRETWAIQLGMNLPGKE